MSGNASVLEILPCKDSEEIARRRQEVLDITHSQAAELGKSALLATLDGFYFDSAGQKVVWSPLVAEARSKKISIPPDAALPQPAPGSFARTRVQVTNETTLMAAKRLVDGGARPLALNFANGVHAGGGYLHGSRAQEETLCRSSALIATLELDPMYDHHRLRQQEDSTDWAIYSPDVPVFRNDDGVPLEAPWLLSFLTCAAPFVPGVGQPESGDLLAKRILRVLAIARAYQHHELILGAWGCGAFKNDPDRTASDFRAALETEFSGAFSQVVFAVTDWSPERRFLGPFRDVFAP